MPRPGCAVWTTTKIFSADAVVLLLEKLSAQLPLRLYWPELITRSAAAMAAAQAVPPPMLIVAQELYAVALTPVSRLKTAAFRYRPARMAFAAPLVTRPYCDAGHEFGSSGSAASSSDSMKEKISG